MGVELEHVREVVERVASSSGLEVVEVELLGVGKSRILRIFIDKPDGVTHQDCADLSREVGTILDVEDAIPGESYVLEVSSPGLDRKLSKPADFERFVGSRVKLTTWNPVNGTRKFEGRLERFEGGRLTLDIASKRIKAKPKPGKKIEQVAPQKLEIEFANIEKANLVPEI
jgi:ribosome maturation factor RimP